MSETLRDERIQCLKKWLKLFRMKEYSIRAKIILFVENVHIEENVR